MGQRGPGHRLPEPWVSVLSGSRRVDGPQGVSSAAVVLPEIDGARFVLAGLSSWERHATLLVFAWGWSHQPREFRPRQPFSWWARDDADRWHVARVGAHDAATGTFQLELTPPLHPGREIAGHHPDRPGRPGHGHAAAGLDGAPGRIPRSRYIVLTCSWRSAAGPQRAQPGRRAEVGEA